jgi:hypothetical protein
MSELFWADMTTNLLVLSYKLACLLVGYKVIRLGADLLVKGVKGEFKFQANYQAWKTDLFSTSPGIFFILMGTIVIVVTVYKGFTIERTPVTLQRSGEVELGSEQPVELSEMPPHRQETR